MEEEICLAAIPEEHYRDYRYKVIFDAYKWDPQVGDEDTIARQVVLLGRETASQLEAFAEALSEETIAVEEALVKRPELAKNLGFSTKIQSTLSRLDNYEREKHVRLMRFDFHPTETGWAVSEVNSDVPGGLAEASILPKIAGRYFDGYEPGKSVSDALLSSFSAKSRAGGRVAFVHATSYSDDQQVMRFLSDCFDEAGFEAFLAAPDHIRWRDKKAFSILDSREGELDGIVRFFPLEWLTNLPRGSDWPGYYDCETCSCNHPIAIFAQSKRLPLVWDELDLKLDTWKDLLPETVDPRTKGLNGDWIFKPALGRVGEGISIKEAMDEKEYRRIIKAVKRHPKDWLAQKKFSSKPIKAPDGTDYHPCVGVFTVDGKCAGFYGRISKYPRIDAKAKDIPLLVFKGGKADV